METTNATLTLAQLATRVPAASRVFQRHDLDFCCGGRRTLEAACTSAGLDPDVIIEEINRELTKSNPDSVRWDQRPLPDLIAFILSRYHAPLRPELEQLEQMSQRVLEVHGHRVSWLARLAELVREISADLDAHMAKEESVLFPWIQSGNGGAAAAPVAVMQREHEIVARQLDELRALTSDFTPPADACNTWSALYVRLGDFDRELREHIHLENNILFPRALAE